MAYIRHLETLVPEVSYPQDIASEVLSSRTESDRTRRYIRKVYAESGIEKRHSVVTDFLPGAAESGLFVGPDGEVREPTTGQRNDVYVREAKKLIPEIARNAIANCPGVEASDITHVITVSCTGFFNPGPDLLVIDALDLSPKVQRYHLGFMGCYAAFPALKMASQFCDLDDSATVLVVCLELCSIHLQNKDGLDSIVANSVFADGAAAAVVTASAPEAGQRGYQLTRFSCNLAREGIEDMAWDIGDHGFNIVLSKYVARIIGAGIKGLIDEVFAGSELRPEDIVGWAVHPGGRAILDKIETSLELESDQIRASREVLAEFGNMSSATVLFVLSAILNDLATKDGDAVCAMAFGPGLTIETGVLQAVVA
ncbi:MAG: type III polyketide synthase [Verrucomicrobiales bacterium]|nr:type III polyketide synthase [Verrucomicrobiales bacterium]